MPPAVSERQRRFMGAELGRLRRGQKGVTGMNRTQLADFARTKLKKHAAKAAGQRKALEGL